MLTPSHYHCESGSDSWCKHQADLVNKTITYKGLPEDMKHIRAILTDLTCDTLHGKTQNQNESLAGTIWKRVPKDTYIGLCQLEIGVFEVVAHFNAGSKAAVYVSELETSGQEI